MKTRTIARLIIDTAMAVVLVLVMATALVQEAPHEYLGITLFALVIAHVVLNCRWFVALSRGRWNAVRVLQLAAIAGLVLCLVGQVASSLVLSKFAFGFLPAIPGASWARRVHMLCSYWSFMFAFAHVGLQFKSVMRWLPDAPAATIWAVRIVLAVVACFGGVSFVQLGLGAYLFGQVQFAFADFATPLALTTARFASVGVLVAGAFHLLRCAFERGDKRLD